jgi:hypothetical protein
MADLVLTMTMSLDGFEEALTRGGERGRHIVEAHRVMVLGESAPPARASPVTHERAGHFRRVAVGTPREHLVWVRSTTVRGADPVHAW